MTDEIDRQVVRVAKAMLNEDQRGAGFPESDVSEITPEGLEYYLRYARAAVRALAPNPNP